MDYTLRPSIIQKTTTYSLTDQALTVAEEGKDKKEILYKDIKSINPVYAPTRQNSNYYMTTIKTNDGKTVRIINSEYKGFGSTEDRSEDYTPFITKLHVVASGTNPEIIFKRGGSWFVYFLILSAYVFGILIFLLFGLGALINENWLVGIGFLVAVFIAGRMFIRQYKYNKPKTYTPDVVPEGVLPKGRYSESGTADAYSDSDGGGDGD